MKRLILLMHCQDKKGIIAAVTNFIHHRQGNIVYIDQYVDRIHSTFFMRVVIEGHFDGSAFKEFKHVFHTELEKPFHLNCSFYLEEKKPKLAVFVSKYEHCLYDILAQQQAGKLHCEIPFILSNHKDLEHIAKRFDLPFYHIEVTKENKPQAEEKQIELLQKHQVDCVVLARYMQIVTNKIISHYPNKIINIHHSFLPAFPGAKPYHSAYERGVKIIGTTSHYVTEELDAGPIIEQDITRVSHAHNVSDFIDKGRDLERLVLLRALKLHTERKVMVYNNKTVVFT